MQAVVHHHTMHTPTFNLALTAVLAAAALALLGLSASGTQKAVSFEHGSMLTVNNQQKHPTPEPTDAMDSLDSVPSLAALRRPTGTDAKPL